MTAPVRTGVAAAARCLALDRAAATTVAALSAHGVASVVLKGAGLADRLYADDPSRRRYSDVDVLVAPTTFDRAQQVLSTLGYHDATAGMRDEEWPWHERSWSLPGPDALTVDLHRSFAGVADPEAFWLAVAASSVPLELGGGTVRAPDASSCALIVALHAATGGNVRKEVADLERAVRLLSAAHWREAAAMARRTGSEAAFAAGLQRIPAGAEVLLALGLVAEQASLQGLAARHGLASAARALAELSAAPGARAKARSARRRLAPSPAFMRRSSRLARHGTAGLLAAYLTRPARLVHRVPGAARQLRQLSLVREAPSGERRAHRTGAAVRSISWSAARSGLWARGAVRQVRRELLRGPLDAVHLPAGPRGGPAEGSMVRRVLRRSGASCLEESLVMQRWYASQHIAVELVITVTSPAHGFHAHARLGGEPDLLHSAGSDELLRRPPPSEWLAG